MKKIRAAIVGYGNIGKYALEAIEAAPDMECAGVVRRAGAENKPAELADYPVVKNIQELKDVDVAILATPTRKVEEYAKQCLALGINTVDSFDIHTQIVDLRRTLDAVAKANNAVSIISAGWDPGSDSIVRTLMEGSELIGLNDGIPAFKAAFERQLADAVTDEHDDRFDIDVFTEADAETLRQQVYGTTKLVSTDEGLIRILRDEINRYYGGQNSAEEAAKTIQSRASIYVAEQYG